MSGEQDSIANAQAASASPIAPPPVPSWKVPLYILASVLFFLTQGLGLNLAFANLTQIQGSIAATTTESVWLSAAYMAPNVSLAIALVKVRLQYGVRNFAEVSILGFILASLLNLFVSDLHSAIVVRFLSGIAGAPLSTLGFLYMLEAFEPAKKMTFGVSLAMMNTLLAAPLTRLVSPSLLDYGEWRGLYTLEMALALLVMPIIYLLPLTSPPRVKVIVFGDIISYALVAIGFGCLAVVLSVGRIYWWLEQPWLGILLAVSIGSLALAALIDLRRATPLIDVRWLLSGPILHLTGILLTYRLIAAEQTYVLTTFYQNAVGLLYDQLQMLYWIILAFSVVGGLICTVLMSYGLGWQIQFVALILMAAGSFMDAQLTTITRPDQMYLSQALMATGLALFLPPSMSEGFKAALSKGAPYLVTFFVVFSFTQSIGGLLGSAVYGTLIIIREKFHSAVLTERVLLTVPDVATRVSQLAGSYGKVIGDSTILKGEGLTLLGAQVTREANTLAYADAFFVAGTVSLVALAGLTLHIVFRFVRARLSDQTEAVTSNP
jgi:MFS family permease